MNMQNKNKKKNNRTKRNTQEKTTKTSMYSQQHIINN